MSRGWRTFLGAMLGALIVLAVHPASRPFLLTALTHWGTSQTILHSDLILENDSVLPDPPKSLVDAGIWMEAGAEQLTEPKSRDLRNLLDVASYAALQDPDNAFWEQMKAVFSDSLAKLPETAAAEKEKLHYAMMAAWKRASRLTNWDDYQTRLLEAVQQELASEFSGPQAWQYAAAYSLRRTEAAHRIAALAREILRPVNVKGAQALELRYETLMNGKLMRDGARFIQIGEIGASLVETASLPKDVVTDMTPRSLEIARTAYFNALMRPPLGTSTEQVAIWRQKARDVHEAFLSNDGWLALTDEEGYQVQTRDLRLASLLTATLPGALLGISLAGGACWALSFALRKKPEILKLVQPPLAPAVGIFLALIVFLATGLPLASLAVAGCFGFLALTPVRERTNAPAQLGPVFEMTIFVLSIVFAVVLGAFVIGLSTPGCEILSKVGAPNDFFGGSTLLLGLSGIVMGLLFLAAPCWAIVQRISTPMVVVLTLRQFGKGLFLGCLVLSICATPVCVLADKLLMTSLSQVVGNEPLYYELNQ